MDHSAKTEMQFLKASGEFRGFGANPAVSAHTANNILTKLVRIPLQGTDSVSSFTTTNAALTGVTDPGVTAQFVHTTQPMDCGMIFLKTASLQSRFGFRLLCGNASGSERLFCIYF